MKKVSMILFVLLALSVFLSACDGFWNPVESNPEQISTSDSLRTPVASDFELFSVWIETNGFAPGMWQGDFLDHLYGFSYQGKSLEACEGAGLYYDGWAGGGYESSSEVWGVTNDYAASEDRTTAHYYNYFYLQQNLDDLALPGNVRIGDAEDRVLTALGVSELELSNGEIQLDDKTCRLSSEDDVLVYQDTYDWQSGDDRVSLVTRTIRFEFSERKLEKFSITIAEDYPLT